MLRYPGAEFFALVDEFYFGDALDMAGLSVATPWGEMHGYC